MTLDEAYDLYRSVRDDGQPTVECIEKLYPLVRERVTRVIGKVLRRTPSEELIVTCTTNVLMAIDQHDPEKSRLSTWLETITRRVCYGDDKTEKSEGPNLDHFQSYAFDKHLDGGLSHDPPAIAPDPSMTELYDKISSLPGEERELIDMLLEGLTHKEISEKWDMPLGTVDWKVRALQKKLAEKP